MQESMLQTQNTQHEGQESESPRPATRQASARGAIARRPSGEPCELSFAQQRLWFLEQLDPGNPTYNSSFSVRLSGPLNREALRQAVNGVVARHEALRTTFDPQGATPVQVIAPVCDVELRLLDLPHDSSCSQEEAATKILKAEVHRPFDLSRDLMLRAALLKLSEQEHILLLTVHHIASDGWSWGILRRELTELYNAASEGRQPQLPELPIQYSDYAVWQRNDLSGARVEQKLIYW
jgi:hypothetical protein